MIEHYSRILTIAAAVGAGIAAGVYFGFSTLVMDAIRKLTPAQAITATSAINKAAPNNPLLMLVLFGTGIICVLLMIAGFRHLGDPAAVRRIVGATLYLVSVLILVGYHLPHNNQLMAVDPNAAGSDTAWSQFLTP